MKFTEKMQLKQKDSIDSLLTRIAIFPPVNLNKAFRINVDRVVLPADFVVGAKRLIRDGLKRLNELDIPGAPLAKALPVA